MQWRINDHILFVSLMNSDSESDRVSNYYR